MKQRKRIGRPILRRKRMKWNKDYVKEASETGSVIAGFNIFGFEDAKAVIRAAERLDTPVILMINRDARRELALRHWSALLKSMAESAAVPVDVHLDHCDDLDVIREAIESGFDSVMYDGSKLPLRENIANTNTVIRWSGTTGALVEAELGIVPYDELGETYSRYTSPEEAAILRKETDVDWLAVSVGNIHRLLGRKAKIDFAALKEIENACEGPFVIHGASGLTTEDLSSLAGTKVGKINIGTSLRRAFGESLREQILDNPEMYDRLDLFKNPVLQVEEAAYNIMKIVTARRNEG